MTPRCLPEAHRKMEHGKQRVERKRGGDRA
jgi:hypothetical protein